MNLSNSDISKTENLEMNNGENFCKTSLNESDGFSRKFIPKINIDFEDISYTVRSGLKVFEKKRILQGVSGSFKSGELTAILGSSGAGKSSLMNILTGYVSLGVTGSIRINGYQCKMKVFRKVSRYIMQDDILPSHLTVDELFILAANLKLSKEYSKKEKLEMIDEILETLGMTKHRNTRTEKLSGGQRKRICVALELINNPSVLFLDEPTTGLDVVSATQVIKMLKKLANQGRTIICTIHQPSAFLCEFFDHMYIMSGGLCVYQGSYQKMVPFLSAVGHECPVTHNPADFIIEILHSKKDSVKKMCQKVQNGHLTIQSSNDKDCDFLSVVRQDEISMTIGYEDTDERFPIPFSKQFSILLSRKLKQQYRNKFSLCISILHHVVNPILLGLLFLGVGNDAYRSIENFKFFLCVIVFFVYTYVIKPVLLFPLEVKLMRREYFNGWYSLEAFYMAHFTSSLPLQLVLGTIFILISYFLSGQPIVLFRIVSFTVIGLMIGLISEGWGVTIGSIFSPKGGTVCGPSSVAPLLAVSLYGVGHGSEIEPIMQFLMDCSYLRHGVAGLALSIYSNNRPLYCDKNKYLYCHYKYSDMYLKDLGMANYTIVGQIMILLVFMIFYRITAYAALRYRVSTDFSNKLFNLIDRMCRVFKK